MSNLEFENKPGRPIRFSRKQKVSKTFKCTRACCCPPLAHLSTAGEWSPETTATRAEPWWFLTRSPEPRGRKGAEPPSCGPTSAWGRRGSARPWCRPSAAQRQTGSSDSSGALRQNRQNRDSPAWWGGGERGERLPGIWPGGGALRSGSLRCCWSGTECDTGSTPTGGERAAIKSPEECDQNCVDVLLRITIS